MEQEAQRKEENEANHMPSAKKKAINIFKSGFIWRPVPTILSTTLCFSISGVIFLVIGIILLVLSSEIIEIEKRYDNLTECDAALKNTAEGPESKVCIIEINIDRRMVGPVMFYYQLNNFYQNHRRYIKSKSVNQLKGNVLTTDQIKTDCDPIITMQDLGISKSIGGDPLFPNATANPCGLIARSYFNDSYAFSANKDIIPEIYINTTGIAWESDLKGRYKNAPDSDKIQWLDIEKESFMVWMRPAGLPDFRKLYGRIKNDLEPGIYYAKIYNFYQVSSFSGKKSIVLSTVNALGGRNKFLGISYVVVGSVCLFMGLLFWVGYHKYNNDKKIKIN